MLSFKKKYTLTKKDVERFGLSILYLRGAGTLTLRDKTFVLQCSSTLIHIFACSEGMIEYAKFKKKLHSDKRI